MKDIIIFSGQSNMQGQTESCPPKTPVDGALEYRFLKDELIPLCHPVGEVVRGDLLWEAYQGKGSLIPDFCKSYIAQTGHEVVAVHAARGATQVYEWLPPKPRFQAFVDKCTAAINKVKETDTIGSVWLVWLQGESDALAAITTLDYKKMLIKFREAVTERIPLDGFGIIRVGKFAEAVTGKTESDLRIIRAQEELCRDDDFTMLTRITGVCTQEPEKWINPHYQGHYNNAAMELIGTTAGANLARAVMGLRIQLEDEPYSEVIQ